MAPPNAQDIGAEERHHIENGNLIPHCANLGECDAVSGYIGEEVQAIAWNYVINVCGADEMDPGIALGVPTVVRRQVAVDVWVRLVVGSVAYHLEGTGQRSYSRGR